MTQMHRLIWSAAWRLTCEIPRPKFTHHVSYPVARPDGFARANSVFYYPQLKSVVRSKLHTYVFKNAHFGKRGATASSALIFLHALSAWAGVGQRASAVLLIRIPRTILVDGRWQGTCSLASRFQFQSQRRCLD